MHIADVALNWVLPLQHALLRSLRVADNFMSWNLITNVWQQTMFCS